MDLSLSAMIAHAITSHHHITFYHIKSHTRRGQNFQHLSLSKLRLLSRSTIREEDNGLSLSAHESKQQVQKATHVFTRDLPSWLLFVELLSNSRRDTDDNVRLDGSERGDSGCSWLGSKGSDSDGEGSVEGSVTIVSEFSCGSARYQKRSQQV
jgi:hypothetical protein